MICHFFTEPSYFFFVSDIPGLLYYSHIPTAIIALLVGIYVFAHGPKKLMNQLLFVISICFSLWTLSNLILWTNIHSDFLLFVWSFLRVLTAFMSIFSIYLVYVFLEKKDISLKIKTIFFLLLAPVTLLAATNFNVSGFDISNCDAFMYQTDLYRFFMIAYGVIAMIWIFGLLVKHYRNATAEFKKQILLMGFGIEFFLLSFFSVVFLAVYLTTIGWLPDSSPEFYGLFGMDVFMIFIAVLIVRYGTFNVSLISSQALVVALVILIGSQYTFNTSSIGTILTSVTLAFTGIIGIMLIRSVHNEIRQREQLEVLTQKLERANKRLKELDKAKSEFVSIASHQLRSPLTSMRGYASMLLDGSYGPVPQKATEVIQRIADSSRFMARMVENYLNVSRIESGNMKYELSDFNIATEAEKLVDDKRQEAIKKGLLLTYHSQLERQGLVHADVGKTLEIVHNLLNNSLKYTPKGTIAVTVRDDTKANKVYVEIKDSGIGMTAEDIAKLFGKFERAKNANSVNITGTGLGLYVARTMALAMKGDIKAFSDGPGTGSTFRLELPMV